MGDQTKTQSTDQKDTTVSSQDSTQQTNKQGDQHTNNNNQDDRDEYIRSLEDRLGAQQLQFRKLELAIENLKSKQSENNTKPQTPRNTQEEAKRFYADPIGVMDERDSKLLAAMEKMIAPIQEVAKGFSSTREYDRLKSRIKSDPIYGKGLKDPDIEDAVDIIMNSGQIEVTEENIKSAISQAYGMKQMGGLRSSGRRVNDYNQGDRIDPPYIPSTRTRTDSREPERRELTEDDKLAMRIAGLRPGNPEHEKQYWDLVTDDTMVLDVHKPSKKGDK